MEGFAHSRKKAATVKDRTTRRAREGVRPIVTTVQERVTREPTAGNVRFLNAAMRSVERMWRLHAATDRRGGEPAATVGNTPDSG